MGSAFASALSGLYLVSGFAIAASYMPQLVRGWRHPEATALAQSLTSWAVWATCRAVALLYGICVIGDGLFILAVALDLLGRVLVLAMLLRAMWLRRRRASALAPSACAAPQPRSAGVS